MNKGSYDVEWEVEDVGGNFDEATAKRERQKQFRQEQRLKYEINSLYQMYQFIYVMLIDTGIHLREGEVNPINGWGKGGGIQYDLMGQRVGEFKNERLLEDR